MTHAEVYKLAKANDPSCIPHLLSIITEATCEILRLECTHQRYVRAQRMHFNQVDKEMEPLLIAPKMPQKEYRETRESIWQKNKLRR